MNIYQKLKKAGYMTDGLTSPLKVDPPKGKKSASTKGKDIDPGFTTDLGSKTSEDIDPGFKASILTGPTGKDLMEQRKKEEAKKRANQKRLEEAKKRIMEKDISSSFREF